MSETTVTLGFQRDFNGVLDARGVRLGIGRKKDGKMAPYDLLLGALGGCFYSTFLGIAEKMRLEFAGAALSIHGVKREEVPTTLKTVEMTFTIRGAKAEKGFRRAAELASKYCSVHETLSRVAEMSLQVVLEP